MSAGVPERAPRGRRLSYQVLARKWRPRGFDEVTGQEHVTTALRNAIRLGRVPHALLLTGPRGVGKTTLARILTRCLNCEKGPTDEPCGECASCRDILAGSSTDVQEIDAASRTSVDDVRDLIESVRYAPSPGKHRIYVVDEVHMLSTPAFNALLKTLEEPPPRSLFVFATTNPEKIPYTVVSRCQRHDLRRLPAGEIAGRLAEIARAEKIDVSERSLLVIAREGDGSLRDALTLLDQVVASAGAKVEDERVARILDLTDRHTLLALGTACVTGDPVAALEAAARAAESGIDAKRLAGELLQLLRDLVVLRVAGDRPGLVEGDAAEIEELRALAGRTDEARLRRMFRALLREQEDLAFAPQPFAVLEMALVRLASMPSGDDVTKLLARLDALERRLAAGGSGTDGGASGGGTRAPSAVARDASAPRTSSAPAGSGVGGGVGSGVGGGASAAAPGPAATAPSTRAPAPPEEHRAEPDDDGAFDALVASDARPPIDAEAPPAAIPAEAPAGAVLDRLRALARETDRALHAALAGVRFAEHGADGLRLLLDQELAAERLRGKQSALEALCARIFGGVIPLRIDALASARSATPAGVRDEEQLRRVRGAVLNHPAINDALEILRAEIVEIRPLGGAS